MSQPERRGRAVRLPTSGLARYLSALAGFDRNVHLFLVVTAFRGLVVAAVQTVLNLYLYSLGYDARFIGIFAGINALAVLLISVPAGYLADRIGRKPVLLVSGVSYPLALLGIALSSATVPLLIFSFAFGILSAGYWVAGVPLLYAGTRDADRVQAFSINSFLLWGLGPVGAFLSGGVVEIAARLGGISASSSGALRVGMLFMVALAFSGSFPYFFIHEVARPARAIKGEVPLRAVAGLAARLLIPDLILAAGVGSILTFVQLYFHVRFGLDPGPIGLIMAVGGLIAGMGTLATPLVALRWGNLRSTVRFEWMAVPLMVGVALAMHLWIAIPVYWALITMRGMADPVYTAFIQEQVPETYRGRITGMYSVTYSIGFSFGPITSGQIQRVAGFTPAFLVAAAIYFLGALLLYLFFATKRWRQEPAMEAG